MVQTSLLSSQTSPPSALSVYGSIEKAIEKKIEGIRVFLNPQMEIQRRRRRQRQ